MPAVSTASGIRAVTGGKPIDPNGVAEYLEGKFGSDLKAVRAAMRKLARSYRPAELGVRAFSLYEQFRPTIPARKKGWGAKGDLNLSAISRLAKPRPAADT